MKYTITSLLVICTWLLCNHVSGQQARPAYNPFNYGMTPQFNFNGFGFQQPQQQFNNGFQQPFNNQFNNGFQEPQQRPQPQLFTRRFHLNNGYLYGRPTLWYDPKSNKMQPWVRKNLR